MAHQWTAAELPSQAGRTVVVTGGAGGIGHRVAEVFAARGARVVIAARNAAKAEAAVAAIRAEHPGADVEWSALDLASLASVRQFAAGLAPRLNSIDLLVNCAGVMAVPVRTLTPDGFEMHFGTNHLGHFALTGLLLPLIGAAGPARVITVSAQSARTARLDLDDLQFERGYAPMRAYGRSKIANILFALELNQHVDPARVLSIPVHPGTAPTDIQQHSASRVANAVARVIMRVAGQPLDRVADPVAFAAWTPEATTESFIAPTGLFELGGPPGFVRLPRGAADPSQRRVLWTASERLTGVVYPPAATAGPAVHIGQPS